jgi:hypothetical protein
MGRAILLLPLQGYEARNRVNFTFFMDIIENNMYCALRYTKYFMYRMFREICIAIFYKLPFNLLY